MNITFITTSFFPRKGGVEKHVLLLSEQLLARKHSVTVLTPRVLGASQVERFQGMRIGRFVAKPFIVAWFSLWNERASIRTADIIHLHDFSSYLWSFPYLVVYRKKFYITFHGWEGTVPPRRLFKILRRFIERRSVGSIAIGDFIAKWYDQHPTIVVYGGVDSSLIAAPKPIMSTPPTVLYIGRLANDTGALEVLETFRQLHISIPGSQFIMLGDGPLRASIRDLILHERLPIELHGWVDDTKPYLQRADVIISTGYLGILEALASGALVCSLYNNDLKRDYITLSPFAAMIIHGGSATAVVHALTTVRRNPSTEVALKRAAHAYVTGHTWSHVADAYEQLWRRNQ